MRLYKDVINRYFQGKYSKDGARMLRKRHRIWSQEAWDSSFDFHFQDLGKSLNCLLASVSSLYSIRGLIRNYLKSLTAESLVYSIV